jgi:hypothetical protein
MAMIYGNAVCTIMAMDALDSNGGLFNVQSSMKDTLTSRAWVIQERMISPRALLYSNNSVRWECRTHDSALDLSHSTSLTLQTSLLTNEAPTHPKQIFAFLRDFRPDGVDHETGQHRFVDFDGGLPCEKQAYTPLLKTWWGFLSLYTPCNLSNASDKFMAMNGIPVVTQRHTSLRST